MNKIIIKEDIIDVIDVDESINVEFQSKTEFFTVRIAVAFQQIMVPRQSAYREQREWSNFLDSNKSVWYHFGKNLVDCVDIKLYVLMCDIILFVRSYHGGV